jgi:hypothetical protein
MKVDLQTAGDGAWAVRKTDDAGRIVEEVTRAYAVNDLKRMLGRSRRQVYRYIKDGWLAPVGKYLGEWLVDARGVEYLKYGRPRRPSAIPRQAKPLFPEYRLEDLHPVRDAVTVIQRVMELGGEREVTWLFHQYPRAALRHWLEQEGWRLTPRSAAFWSLVLKTRAPSARPMPGGGTAA